MMNVSVIERTAIESNSSLPLQFLKSFSRLLGSRLVHVGISVVTPVPDAAGRPWYDAVLRNPRLKVLKMDDKQAHAKSYLLLRP